jgi:HAD superfamily hydrolase (TIGR01484 family)
MKLKLIAFDLDGTLAPSKGPISDEMAKWLKRLLDVAQVCIISGGTEKQIFEQVLDRLPANAKLQNLHLMPTSGSKYMRKKHRSWKTIYSENFTKDQSDSIKAVVRVAAALHGFWPEKAYGPIIEDRGGQITYSALGQQAPRGEKEAWDPDGSKRESFRKTLSSMLPRFDVKSGGSTSVDITKLGIDKGYGIYELLKRNRLSPDQVLFIGDRLEQGGNDYPVHRTGVKIQAVSGPQETLVHVKNLLKFL